MINVKELLQRLASYNVWANQRLADISLPVAEELLTQKVIGSFPSIRSTVLHIVDAESIWWQRINLQEIIQRPSESFAGTTRNVLNMLATQNLAWKAWVERQSVTGLTSSLTYRNFKNEEFAQPVYEILMHLFNHGTYHRGQWVNQLRECGLEKIPATDFIVFSRSA
jgi:uncharacterized damage-inducible protein DinB